MKIVEANAVIMDDIKLSPYQIVEKIGRTCYKSEDLITEDSAERFVKVLQKNRHWAMLEHYHLIFDIEGFEDRLNGIKEYPELLKYFNITKTNDGKIIFSGSFRAFLELFEKIKTEQYQKLNAWLRLERKCADLFPLIFDDPFYKAGVVTTNFFNYYTREDFIKFIKDRPDETELAFRHLTHTVLFTCDRGVTHEFVRHRPASFAQESTRYCNYSKGKFGEEITVIKPCFFEENTEDYNEWKETCEFAEKHYFSLVSRGRTPQEARSILPNSLKADLIITATEEEWEHIIALRYMGVTGKPHPQMVEVMQIAYDKLVEQSKGRLKVKGD